jgi:hypothetical protein
MPETCRVSWQNKILDTWCILLVIYMKIITMHGHLNINLPFVWSLYISYVFTTFAVRLWTPLPSTCTICHTYATFSPFVNSVIWTKSPATAVLGVMLVTLSLHSSSTSCLFTEHPIHWQQPKSDFNVSCIANYYQLNLWADVKLYI